MLFARTNPLAGCVLTMLALFLAPLLHAQLPAFPGAEGAGMYSTGGRGTPTVPTTVFEVTNLLDDNRPGSLRYALTAAATYRTVVFRVSGTIHLNSRLSIRANTTIAGQTAPGDGICIADHPVSVSGDNVIVRYVRFRLGDKHQKKVDANGNPVDGSGSDDAFGGLGPSNIIVDHITASWSSDEAFTIYRGDNLTIQWCMISEPLNYSYHFETGDTDYEQHGYGGIWGAKRGSMHHNLIAHCRNRNPRFAGISTYTPNTIGIENADFRNNVIYNWGINTVYGGEGGNYNVVNNYYKYGPNTGRGVKYRICNPSNSATVPYGKWYVNGNYVDGSPANTADNWAGVSTADPAAAMATTPFDLGYPLSTQTAQDAFESVLQRAGCTLPNRDTLDQRIVNDVRNRTGRIIDVQGGYPHATPYDQTVNAWPTLAASPAPVDSDHDGMPDSYETANGFNPNDAADRNGYASNGYTNLENYLSSLTDPVASTDPVYTADNADAVVALDGSGGYTSVQAAIDAAPAGETIPFVIFIKNGKYVEKVKVPSNKPFIHLVGESVAHTIISWNSYSGKIEGGVVIGTNTSATLTVNANDFFMMGITVENSTGYTGDGPQAVAVYISGDRCVYRNCRFIGGQDTLWHNGNGRHYFKNCYIDGNTDFIFGSSTALFDSCVIYPRDRVDGGGGGYITAANTAADKAYGEVFRDCILTKNRGVTSYSLGRPWQNVPKTVYLNTVMGASINPGGWSTWNIDTSIITYAEYKSKKYDHSPVDVSKRVSWSKQLNDTAAAAYYNNANLFGTWDPYIAFPAINAPLPTALAVANFRAQRSGASSILSWNICWPMSGVTYELYRSLDSINYAKIGVVTGAVDSVVAFSLTDTLPAKGVVYYYYVKASKTGYPSTNSYVAVVDPSIPLNGDYRSRASGNWTNNGNISIWEKYNSTTRAWDAVALGTGASGNVTISTGDTVALNALAGISSLTIDSGAVFQTDGQSRNIRVKGDVDNAGIFGGLDPGFNKINLELDGTSGVYSIAGNGIYNFGTLRPLTAVQNLTININADLTLNGNLQAWYGSASAPNYAGNNVIININKGITVKASALNSTSSTNTAASFGNYTYNVNGTLDLGNSSAVSGLIPHATATGSSITLNVNGVLKTGSQFRTVSTAPGASEGKVILTIGEGGLIDAASAEAGFAISPNYFVVNGNGSLKRAVGNTAVVFPIGTSADSYSPVTLTNTGTADNFLVTVKSSFDHPIADSTKVVNKQWSITEDVEGGSDVTATFGWFAADQAAAFDPAQLLAVMQYDSTWKIKAAAPGGSGTQSDPYAATVSGLTGFSDFGVTNYLDKMQSGAVVELFTINGLLLRSLGIKSYPQLVPVNGLPKGIYLAVVRMGGRIATEKIVIQ